MALRNLRISGDDILRKKCREVKVIDNRIKTVLKDMLDTMYDEEGIGLAAPQIGVLKRLIVIDIGDGNVYKMINPVVSDESGEQIAEEGCLSVIDFRGNVKRPKKLTVTYQDEDSNLITMEAEDLLARAICHEVDHLEGVLFIDKVEK